VRPEERHGLDGWMDGRMERERERERERVKAWKFESISREHINYLHDMTDWIDKK
jgi:hypothetical protein